MENADNDDYNPQEAVNRFRSNLRSTFTTVPPPLTAHPGDHALPPVTPRVHLTPEDILNIMNPDGGEDSNLPFVVVEDPNLPFVSAQQPNVTSAPFNDTLLRLFIPPDISSDEDGMVLPVVLSVIGLCAIIGNVLVLFAFFGYRRMRTGQNLMLVNVAVADLLFVLVTVPVAVLNYAAGPGAPHDAGASPPPQLCRFVHYIIFVGVYVAVYTLVVTCVFRFFAEFTRCGGSKAVIGEAAVAAPYSSAAASPAASRSCVPGTIFSPTTNPRAGGGAPALTLGNAALSCAVIWVAFMTSHLNFLIQSEGAIFEEPFICEQYEGGPTDTAKLRTLWVTFLTCAFLLPLLIVCTLSTLVLRGGRGSPGRGQRIGSQPAADSGQTTNGRLINDVLPHIEGNGHSCGERGNGYGVRDEGYGGRGEGCGGCRARGELNVPDLYAADRRYEMNVEDGRRSARLFPNGSYSPGACSRDLRNPLDPRDLPDPRDPRDPRSPSPMPPVECRIVAQQSPPRGLPSAADRRLPSAAVGDESAQNRVNDARGRRDLTIVVLASTAARCLCWLPLQILLLCDVFTPGPGGPLGATGPQGRPGDGAVAYRRAEMAAVCFAFAATCVNPVVYQCACAEFRRVCARMFARCGCGGGKGVKGPRGSGGLAPPLEMVGKASQRPAGGDMNETILSIISDSSNRINYVA